ncbi:hypothetical protein L1887_20142 [Cichorium endivia]|nr:hypothetical protein L1887_20142 [Cichorium endivia]
MPGRPKTKRRKHATEDDSGYKRVRASERHERRTDERKIDSGEEGKRSSKRGRRHQTQFSSQLGIQISLKKTPNLYQHSVKALLDRIVGSKEGIGYALVD